MSDRDRPGNTEGRGAPETPSDARHELLRRRVEELERSLQHALGELASIHASRLWKVGERYWQVRSSVLFALRRMLRPWETARVVAPRVLPVRLRARLVRLWRRMVPGRPAGARPEGVEEAWRLARADAAAATPPRPTVIWLPIIDWGFRYQRPQQMASRLARRGWPVFYTAMQVSRAARGVARSAEPLAPGVWGVTLPARREVDLYREPLAPRAVEGMVRAFDSLRREAGIHEAVVVCQLPSWRPLAEALRDAMGWPIVYDRLDYHAGFTTNTRAAVEEEGRLLEVADVVLASSAVLEEDARGRARSVVRVPNGCDWEHWSADHPARLPVAVGKPVVGYFGAIAEWFDADLVTRLATSRPYWSFVLIGATSGARLGRLHQLPNVHLLGEQPYALLPAMAAAFDVGIIPFRRTPLTLATDPVKLYEMLALGLPVVATRLPELEAHGDLVSLAEGPAEFLAALDGALAAGGGAEARARRRAFAAANRWEDRVDRLEGAISRCYPLVTIGVVTFNNLAMTRLCLESIFRVTAYPRFEVVVVDNGSSDGTPEYLGEQWEGHESVRVTCNRENRGFAAASNQALQAARGDVFCFLNNDTVVSAGWLSALVRWLRRDPKLGLVGPVTNAIGNEARVAVGYADLEDMPEWASRYVLDHDGESFEISMLALYCAAMRRDVWQRVGLLDERFQVGMFEDDDYCRRLGAAGYEVRCVRDSFVHHWQRAAFRLLGDEVAEEVFQRNREAFRAKWRGGSS